MKKILIIASGIAAVFAMISSASAHANPYDPYAGQTYAKVQEQTRGGATIASRTGSYLPTEECIVTGSRRTSFLDSSGNGSAKILVDLNCNDTAADLGHPGNSVAKPEGQRAHQLREAGKNFSESYAKALAAGQEPWCAEHAERCVQICKQSGTCSADLLEYLGL